MPVDKEIFGDVEIPVYTDADIFRDAPRNRTPTDQVVSRETVKNNHSESSNLEVFANSLWKGAAAVPDMVLNAPQNVVNLGRAAVGTVTNAMGRPDLSPDIVPTLDVARRAAEAGGLIRPDIQPQGTVQKAIDLLGQGAAGGALTGGGGLARTLLGGAAGATSAGLAGATEAATGQPALAAIAGMAPGARAALSNPAAARAAQSRNYVADETIRRGQQEGYVTPPSAVDPSFIGNRIEGIAGKAALGQESALRNQPITNQIARREAGLGENETISTGTLSAARDRMAAPYREVAAMSPLAASALERLRQARHDSNLEWAHFNRQGDPAAYRRAETLDNQAQMYEAAIDRIASRQGNPDLLTRLREARVNIAKNHEVERALNVGSGDVDARTVGRAYDRTPGRITDGLETIGRFSNAFPLYTRDAATVPAPGVSKLEGITALSLGLGGGAVGGPAGAALGAIPILAPPALRSLALSRLMQGQRQYGPSAAAQVGERVSPIATSEALTELMRQRGN